MTYISPEKWPSLFAAVEKAAREQVVDDQASGFTDAAFDHWISGHGVPTTANDARLLLEYAALLGAWTTKLDLE